MAWKNTFNAFNEPDKDTGWGLIFRLNTLFEAVDWHARQGNYSEWEIALDRIFCNLMYRNEATVEKDDENKIIDVKINDEEYKIWEKVKLKITTAKCELIAARKTKNISKYKFARVNYYNSLIFYDIWLRKFMQGKKLYLKESSKNPSNAMWGG